MQPDYYNVYTMLVWLTRCLVLHNYYKSTSARASTTFTIIHIPVCCIIMTEHETCITTYYIPQFVFAFPNLSFSLSFKLKSLSLKSFLLFYLSSDHHRPPPPPSRVHTIISGENFCGEKGCCFFLLAPSLFLPFLFFFSSPLSLYMEHSPSPGP